MGKKRVQIVKDDLCGSRVTPGCGYHHDAARPISGSSRPPRNPFFVSSLSHSLNDCRTGRSGQRGNPFLKQFGFKAGSTENSQANVDWNFSVRRKFNVLTMLGAVDLSVHTFNFR